MARVRLMIDEKDRDFEESFSCGCVEINRGRHSQCRRHPQGAVQKRLRLAFYSCQNAVEEPIEPDLEELRRWLDVADPRRRVEELPDELAELARKVLAMAGDHGRPGTARVSGERLQKIARSLGLY